MDGRYPFSAREAGGQDLALLARLNRILIEDEGSNNPMTLPELEARMAELLRDGYTALLFDQEGVVLGYALYRVEQEEGDAPAFVFLKQFVIVHEHRRRGYGIRAVDYLLRYAFPQNAVVSLDVLHANAAGRNFWEKAGFTPYYTNLKRWPEKQA